MLRRVEMSRSTVTDCLYIGEGLDPAFNVAYVDNLLIICSRKAVSKLKSSLKSIFVVTEQGPCTHFLGMIVTLVPSGILLSQPTYGEHIIRLCGMVTSKEQALIIIKVHG